MHIFKAWESELVEKSFPKYVIPHFLIDCHRANSLTRTLIIVRGVEPLGHKILSQRLCLQALRPRLYSYSETTVEKRFPFIHETGNWLKGMLQIFDISSTKDLNFVFFLEVSCGFGWFIFLVLGTLVYENNSCGWIIVIVWGRKKKMV